jgi:hypothetical protein
MKGITSFAGEVFYGHILVAGGRFRDGPDDQRYASYGFARACAAEQI